MMRINTAAVPTNTKMKEHKPNCVSYFGLMSFYHSLCHQSCFRTYFQLYQPQWIFLKILSYYAILLLTEKRERVRPAFKGMHTLVCFNEINMLVSTYSGLGLFCELCIRRVSYHYKHLKIIL